MFNIRNIVEDLFYIGCSDRKATLFEAAYPLSSGMSYNSYLLIDEKTVLFDTVDKSCGLQFLENLKAALDGRTLDYFVIHHMEPDHCALLQEVLSIYPEVTVVCTSKTVSMIKEFFNIDVSNNSLVVKEGDTLSIGKHTFKFIMAPMVHWPEVMVTYDQYNKILFSADAFGSFGAINGNLFDDELDWEKKYLDEARRYYVNIVGKYGLQVQMMLKKTMSLSIKMICPLHGVMIRQNINKFIDKYDKWSSYTPEEQGVVIAYSSVYGNTESTVDIIASKLAMKGIKNIKMFDVSMTHPSFVLSDAFQFSHIILATTTYNAGIFETMETFLNSLVLHNLQNRKYVVIQNGSWAPACGAKVNNMLQTLKGSEIISELCVKSSLKEDQLVLLDNIVGDVVKSLSL